jgi:hypothetical protein
VFLGFTSYFDGMNPDRFQEAIRRIDAVNASDPRGIELPYAQRLSAWVVRLSPDASEPLRLAARGQHIARWEVLRDTYPAGRIGYLKWREDMKHMHAQKAGAILREVGYDEATIQRVQDLMRKRNFPRDPEGRILEDALCLVFLETQFAETVAKTGKDKMIGILQKTWQKMTPQARALALTLPMTDGLRGLVVEAWKEIS